MIPSPLPLEYQRRIEEQRLRTGIDKLKVDNAQLSAVIAGLKKELSKDDQQFSELREELEDSQRMLKEQEVAMAQLKKDLVLANAEQVATAAELDSAKKWALKATNVLRNFAAKADDLKPDQAVKFVHSSDDYLNAKELVK